jgi:hypothetical protein
MPSCIALSRPYYRAADGAVQRASHLFNLLEFILIFVFPTVSIQFKYSGADFWLAESTRHSFKSITYF